MLRSIPELKASMLACTPLFLNAPFCRPPEEHPASAAACSQPASSSSAAASKPPPGGYPPTGGAGSPAPATVRWCCCLSSCPSPQQATAVVAPSAPAPAARSGAVSAPAAVSTRWPPGLVVAVPSTLPADLSTTTLLLGGLRLRPGDGLLKQCLRRRCRRGGHRSAKFGDSSNHGRRCGAMGSEVMVLEFRECGHRCALADDDRVG
eukprot:9476494-Pyramimonas_sp.AAC.1